MIAGDPQTPKGWLWIVATASGALLYAAFAPLEISEAAWIALVPLMVALRFQAERAGAFRMGLLAGAVFWIASIWWLSRVTIVGWLVLAMYCAIYIGLFALAIHEWLRRFGAERILPNLGMMVFAACAWAGLEWFRSTFATGFAWNPLGASLYRNIALLQPAAWGGAYAVSALIVWVNAGIAVTVIRYIERRGRWGRRPHVETMLGVLVLALTFWGGARRAQSLADGPRELRVALIQTAIPQDEKWDAEKVELIYSRLSDLTRAAHRAGTPDLVIWPETALPDDVRYSQPSYDLVYALCQLGAPILVGSMDSEWPEDAKPRFFNSSFLFDTEGRVVERYDKQHLVMFGEYVPFQQALPFLKAMTPIQESFTAGTNATIFRLEQPSVSFATLICFEDTVSHLARRAVKAGARLLVNQTNDAWFDPSSASRQHMAQCVLRVVETGVPALRAANTGVTCWIDRRGVVASVLQDANGGTIFPGFLNVMARPAPDDLDLTFYARHGDVLPISAGLFALGVLALLIRTRVRL